jgi:hypothetical protein
MKKSLAAACLLAMMLIPGAVRGQSVLRHYKEIETEPLKREEILAVPLDSDIYAAAGAGLTDLRIIDATAAEVPYLLEKATEKRTLSLRKSAPAKDLSLREQPDGGLEIQFSRDDRFPPAEGIDLVTPLTNYQHRVQVSGSNDGQKWETLVRDAIIFDYSRYLDVSNHSIALPPNRYARFRIGISDVTAQQQSELLELTRRIRAGQEAERSERVIVERRPFRIDRIELWYTVTQQNPAEDQKKAYPVADFQAEPAQWQTIIHVHTRREPLTGFTVQSSSRNFHRQASVEIPEARGVHTDWQAIGRAGLSQIDFRDLRRAELKISFPEHRTDLYRVIIDNGDSPPLAITGIEGEGNVYRLLFLARPENRYQVYYGSEAAKPPSYDTAAIRELLGRGYQPILARLGGQLDNPHVAEPASLWYRAWLNNPIFLGTVICLLVAVLGWALYRASLRVERTEPDSGTRP